MDEQFVIDRIKELERNNAISEAQIASDLGYSEGYLHCLLSGEIKLTIPIFLLICHYFEISPHDFFCENRSDSALIKHISNDIKTLSSDDLHLLSRLVARMKK